MNRLLLFTCFLVCIGVCANARVWHRIPTNKINKLILDFVAAEGIHECFEGQRRGGEEEEHMLVLKCWKENELYDVVVNMKPAKKGNPRRLFPSCVGCVSI